MKLVFSAIARIFWFTFYFVTNSIDYESMHRLPSTTIPSNYTLELDVKLEPDFAFDGAVHIDFVQDEATQVIILHSWELIIDTETSFLIDKQSDEQHTFRILGNYESNNFLVLEFENILNEGKYSLHLRFQGILSSKKRGFYKTMYGDGRWMASTHFQPASARRMFPCFDEPQYKATFDLRVKHPADRRAISNGAIIKILQSEEDTQITYFERTPIMSTYLVALAVTDFDQVESELNNKKYRLHVEPEKIDSTQYAQESTLKAIELFESQLGVEYSVNKLDQIVVPRFGGGMENWGLIVYGELVFTYLNLVTHELAHQWFGNLITCQWWSYTWLNEGFATYYENLIADAIEPESRIMEIFVTKTIREVMPQDSLNSRPINAEVEALHELWSKFNSLTYIKGGAIVYFMSLTFENFNSSITTYLKENAFKTVGPYDLCSIMGRNNEIGRDDACLTLSTWIEQAGFPVVTLTIDYETNVASITQKRFLVSPRTVNSAHYEKWFIPITMSTESEPDFENTNPIDWIKPQNDETLIQIPDSTGWVLLNHKSAVFCRNNYDPTNWKRITDYLNGSDYQNIHPINRAQVIDDALNLARAGEISYEIALNLTTYLHQEENVVVWSGVEASLMFLGRILIDTPLHYNFTNYISHLSGHVKTRKSLQLEKLNFDRDLIKDFNKKFNELQSHNKNGVQVQELEKVFSLLSENIFDEQDYREVKRLFVTKMKALDHIELKLFNVGLERISQNIEYKVWWISQYYEDIERWMHVNYYF